MRNAEQLNTLAENLKKMREAASKNVGAPASAQAQPEVHDRNNALADLDKEIEGHLSTIAVRDSEIEDLKVHVRDLEEEISKREAEKVMVKKSGVADKLLKAEDRIAQLQEELKRVSTLLSRTQSELEKERAEPSPASVAPNTEKAELAERTKQLEAEVLRLNALVKERDEKLKEAITPEAIEEIKGVFADAIFYTFKEVESQNPGLLARMLPHIERESRDLIQEAFRVHGEDIIMSL